jgi:subtilisin-like proprotein convertase family protein
MNQGARLAAMALVVLLALFLGTCAEATLSLPDGLEIIRADVRDVSPRLSELAKLALRTADATAERAREANPPRRLREARPLEHDPVIQRAAGTGTIPTPIANFEGMGTGLEGYLVQSAPPDTVGDIGPDHYFQIVNFSVAIFDRTGRILLGPVPTRNLWSGFGGACAQTNDGDATVRYDRIGKRWIVGQFSVNGGRGPFYQCVAVSTSADPLGTYHRYQYNYAAFNDYPKLALWPGAYYFTFNIFQDNVFQGSKACAMDRIKMMSGGDATMHCFNTGADYGGLLASDLDGEQQPPKDSPNYLLAYGVNELQLWKMHADFSVPANDTFIGPLKIPVGAFSPLCDTVACVKQPGTTQALDSLGDRLMNRLVYRRFPDHETLLVSHAVVAGGSGGVRWYELRAPGASLPTVYQQGTYAPDSSYRFMSSIAMDAVGNIALGYAISGSTVSPGIRYTGRLVSDPLGTMGQGEGTIVAGFGAQSGGLSRYGDYSSMNIDPLDDCTFWYTQEYIGARGSFNWRTRVGSFKFSTCGAAKDDFTLSLTPTSGTLNAGGTATFTVETAQLAGNPIAITLAATGLPSGVTASFVPPVVTAGATSQLTLSAVPGTRSTAAQVIVTGTGPGAEHAAGLALTVAGTLAAAGPAGVDDDGAVAAAALPRKIPDNNSLGVVATRELAAVGNGGDELGALAISLDVRHPYRGDLIVTLTSPGGVQHVLTRRAGGAERDLVLDRVALPAFVGQALAGTWTLQVQDRASGDVGELRSWALHPTPAAATAATAATWAAEATPDRPIIDNGKLCQSVVVKAGADVEASAVTLELVARHDFGAALKASLAHNGVSVPAFPTGTFAAGRGVWRLGPRRIPGFTGAAAGTWTLCLEDADGFGDTGDLRSWAVRGGTPNASALRGDAAEDGEDGEDGEDDEVEKVDEDRDEISEESD